MHASRGGYPGPVTSKTQRLSGGAYPRKSGEILSQRPTIHRPQHSRTAEPFGVRLSLTSQPRSQRVPASLGWDRKSLPRLERAQDAQPPVKDPASTEGEDATVGRAVGSQINRGSTLKETPCGLGGDRGRLATGRRSAAPSPRCTTDESDDRLHL